jgi:type I restriction enzyme S subunit
MAGDWQETKIIDVVQINTAAYSTNEKWEYVNYLDTSNITNGQIAEIQLISDMNILPSRARRKVKAGDIVYSTVRPNQKHYGIIKEPKDNMLVSTGFAVLRGKNQISYTKFLYYFLIQNHIVEKLQTIAEHSTSAYPSIRPSDIESLKLKLPPFAEQQAIAHILGTLDDKIELNRRMNKTMEEMARAIFKSWFVDFDPVHAKAAVRREHSNWTNAQVSRAALPNLSPEIAELFPDALEDSDLGEIPKGWAVETVGNICEFAYGKALKADQRQPGRVLVMGSNGQVGTHNEALVKGPGIVVGRKGNPGIVTWVNSNFFPIDTTFYVVPKRLEYPLTFLLYALENLNLASLGADSAVPGLNRNIAYRSQLIIPDNKILKAFEIYATTTHNRQGMSEKEIHDLTALRDTLLPKLISGELRIKD